MVVVEKAVVLDMALLVEDMAGAEVEVAVVAVLLLLGVQGMEVGRVKEEVQGMVLVENMGVDMAVVVVEVVAAEVVAV